MNKTKNKVDSKGQKTSFVIPNSKNKRLPIGIIGLGMILLGWAALSAEGTTTSEMTNAIVFLISGAIVIAVGLVFLFLSFDKSPKYTITENGIELNKKKLNYSFKDMKYYKHSSYNWEAREYHRIMLYDSHRTKLFKMKIPRDMSAYEIVELLQRHLDKL